MDLFFKGIERGELGIIDLLIELFKIRSKLWWVQKDAQTIEKIKLYGVQLEDDTIKNPTECEEMEHCRFFNSKMLCEVMRSLTDTHIYAENKKNDVEADISKYISFCIVTLKTAMLLRRCFRPRCEQLHF